MATRPYRATRPYSLPRALVQHTLIVPISPYVRRSLRRALDVSPVPQILRHRRAYIIRPAKWHLSLGRFGPINGQLGPLMAGLRQTFALITPFDASFVRLDGLPTESKARCLCLTLGQGEEVLAVIGEFVAARAKEAGITFKAAEPLHLTLGILKRNRGIRRYLDALPRFNVSYGVRQLALCETRKGVNQRGRRITQHRTLALFRLNGHHRSPVTPAQRNHRQERRAPLFR